MNDHQLCSALGARLVVQGGSALVPPGLPGVPKQLTRFLLLLNTDFAQQHLIPALNHFCAV